MTTPHSLKSLGPLGALCALLVATAMFTRSHAADPTRIDLAGQWRFALDRADIGIAEDWSRRALPDPIRLPGALQSQGYGDEISVDTQWTGNIIDRSWFENPRYEPYRRPGQIKVPFWLQPDRHYVGPAWFTREITIPDAWRGTRVILAIERAHWSTRAWIDGQSLGQRDSLSVAHEYELPSNLPPGPHRLTLRVDNRLAVGVGPNAHSVSDHTQGNWNGAIGAIELRSGPAVWIDDVQVYPDVTRAQARLRVTLRNRTANPFDGLLTATPHLVGARSDAPDPNSPAAPNPIPPTTAPATIPPGGTTTLELVCPLGPHAPRWDEFSPALHRLHLSLNPRTPDSATVVTPAAPIAQRELVFGLREVRVDGTHIALNGRPLFLRGTLECCIFPLTGHPPMDTDSWRRILRICKAHGLNHLRFHSWCPPEAAFVAADEMGFYYQVEAACWINQGNTVGDGLPVDAWMRAEADRILRAYGNHPSFLLMAHGNEPAGKQHKRFLGDLVAQWRAKDPRRLYTAGAGWPEIPQNDYHLTPKPRIQGWGEGLKSRINRLPPETETDYRDTIAKARIPVVSHEIGQWCVYPNLDEIAKYTGPLKAKNFEIFKDHLAAAGMAERARDFLIASGKLQALCYKEEIESALRTPGMAGFHLLDLHDFPGQGTALVGVLDPFWESKGYIAPEEYRRFCAPTVPLARMPRRVWTSDQSLVARVDVAHYGPRDLRAARVAWRLRADAGREIAAGQLPARDLPTGALTPIGEIAVPLGALEQATKLNLEIALADTDAANDWDLWVYPAATPSADPPGITVARALDATARTALDAGGKVLLLPPPDTIPGDALGRVQMGFSPIFWNTAWTRRQPPHTLGILCDPSHPALRGFPTESHSNWQWWELVSRSHPFILADTPRELRPLIHAIDDWVTNRKLALAFEARVGPGKLLACAIDLESDLPSRPVARELRRALLAYMTTPNFNPTTSLPPHTLDSLGAR